MANILDMISNSITSRWSNGTQSQSISSTSTGTGGSMFGGISAPFPPPSQTPSYAMREDSYAKLRTLESYIDMCGDKLEYIRLTKNIETSDPKISMLKLLKIGEFLKGVGLKFDDDTYYVIREQE